MFIHLSFDRHLACLHIFSIVNNTSVKMGTQVFESFLPVLLDMYLGAELLDRMVNLCLTFWGMCLESDVTPLENAVRCSTTILSPSPFMLNPSPAQAVFPKVYPKPVHVPEAPQPPSCSHFPHFFLQDCSTALRLVLCFYVPCSHIHSLLSNQCVLLKSQGKLTYVFP